MLLKDINFRDPFVLPVMEESTYYLYGSDGATCWGMRPNSLDAYCSKDLIDWTGPHQVFVPDSDFWAEREFWAPEVHFFKGNYYMFVSFKAEGRCRGTQILRSPSPLGPFLPISEAPITPSDWECLDGTFFVDESGPWIVFCHEWVQVHDGEMCAMRLTEDLKQPLDKPALLFRASEAPWAFGFDSTPADGLKNYVTDGPFICKAVSGELIMLWSSMHNGRYAIGYATSHSGRITGPWIQSAKPVFSEDGGHGMLFKTFENQLMLAIHCPNSTLNERPVFINASDLNWGLRPE